MKQLGIINPEKVSNEAVSSFTPRLAARAIVFDVDKNVALLHVSKHNYYKLPGGGMEVGEDKIEALKRECKEEIGSDIEVISELGEISEYRSQFSMFQTSYCYIAKLVGEIGEPAFTELEISGGFEKPIWIPLNQAIDLVTNSKPNDYQGTFIRERDGLFLKTAMEDELI